MTKDLYKYGGKEYAFTKEELEAAFRIRDRQYMEEDAKNAILIHTFGTDDVDIDALTSDEQEELACAAWRDGLSAHELLENIETVVDCFEYNHDCNVDENTLWQYAVDEAIRQIPKTWFSEEVQIPGVLYARVRQKLEWKKAGANDSGEDVFDVAFENGATLSYKLMIDDGEYYDAVSWTNPGGAYGFDFEPSYALENIKFEQAGCHYRVCIKVEKAEMHDARLTLTMSSELRAIALAKTLIHEMETDDERWDRMGHYMAKAIMENKVDDLLIAICGWTSGSLLEKAEELMKDPEFLAEYSPDEEEF